MRTWLQLRCALLVLAVSAVCANAPASGKAAQAATPVGRVAFVSDGVVWVMNPDGSAKRRLTALPRLPRDRPGRVEGVPPPTPLPRYLAWDPSGRYLACTGLPQLLIIDTRTGHIRRLALPTNRQGGQSGRLSPLGYPLWAKDGKSILLGGWFSEEVTADGGLWQIPVDGKAPRLLVAPADMDFIAWLDPVLSPDGRYLASWTRSDGLADLRLYDFKLGKLRLLHLRPRTQEHIADIGWLDRTTLLLALDAEPPDRDMAEKYQGEGGLWRYDIVTGQVGPLADVGRTTSFPTVHGQLVAYLVYPKGSQNATEIRLRRVGRGRATPRSLTLPNRSVVLDPQAWSPDGLRLLVSASMPARDPSNAEGWPDVWMAETTPGVRPHLLLECAGSPVWSPR